METSIIPPTVSMKPYTTVITVVATDIRIQNLISDTIAFIFEMQVTEYKILIIF